MAPDPSEVTNPLVRLVLLDGVGHCVRRDAPEAYHGLVDPIIEEAFGHAGRRPKEGPDPAGIGALLAKSPGSICQDCYDPVKNTPYRSHKLCSDTR